MAEKLPFPANTRITDKGFCFCFLLCVFGSVGLVAASIFYGNIYRLTHAYQWDGQLCGISDGVVDKPYVFYCAAAPESGDTVTTGAFPPKLDYESKTCVAQCPTSNLESLNCLMRSHVVPNSSATACPGGNCSLLVDVSQIEMVQSVVATPAYQSRLYRSRYCVPDGAGSEDLKEDLLNDHFAKFPRSKRFAGSLWHAWPVVLGAVVLSLIVGRIYLSMMAHYAGVLIFATMWSATVLMFVLGIFFLLALFCNADNSGGFYAGANPLMRSYWGAEAKWLSILIGLGCIIYGFGLLHASRHLKDRIDKDIGIVTAAMHCVCYKDPKNRHPDYVWEPFIKALFMMLEVIVLGIGLLLVTTVGTEDNYNISINGEKYQDQLYTFKWYPGWTIAVLFYCFTCIWIHEWGNARFHYAITWAIAAYYCAGNKPIESAHGLNVPGASEHVMVTVGGVQGGGAREGHVHRRNEKGEEVAPYLVVPLGPTARPYSVQDYTKDVKADMQMHGCFHGTCHALTHCVGSVAKAALMGVLTSPVRSVAFVMRMIAGRDEARTNYDEMDQRGKLKSVTTLVASMLDNSFEGYGKNSFLEMVLEGDDYTPAAKRNFLFVEEVAGAVGYLFGVCATYGNLATVLLTTLVTLTSSIILQSVSCFSDPDNDGWYVPDPAGMVFLILILSASTIYGHIALFGHGADTLLYTFAWGRRDSKWPPQKCCPAALKNILRAEMAQEPEAAIHPHGTKFDNLFHAFRTFGGTAVGTHAEQAPLISTAPGGPGGHGGHGGHH